MHDDDPGRAEAPPPGERASLSGADALVLMAQTPISSGAAERATADGYQVVVHVDPDTLAGGDDGACRLEDGSALHPETARRLGCDASLVRISSATAGRCRSDRTRHAGRAPLQAPRRRTGADGATTPRRRTP
jgi:Domain of unknown function (DUF222)